jgi:plastocyanin
MENTRMKRYLSIVSLLAVVVLLVAACGGGSEPTPAPTAAAAGGASAQEVLNAITVEMHDIYFGAENNNVENPPVWTVQPGQAVTMNFDNKGALEHSWAVLRPDAEMPMPYTDADADKLLYTSGHLAGATQKTDTFTAPTEAGEYIVFCTVAGHYPVMQGRLVVQ